jgi:hypothetical protein
VNGQRILVEHAKPKCIFRIEIFKCRWGCFVFPSTSEVGNKENFRDRLYIGRLPANITKTDLVNAFSKYGEISDILIKDDFAFIVFNYLSF